MWKFREVEVSDVERRLFSNEDGELRVDRADKVDGFSAGVLVEEGLELEAAEGFFFRASHCGRRWGVRG